MLDHHTSSITVKACIIGEHTYNMFSLIRKITRAPRTRNDNHWTNVA